MRMPQSPQHGRAVSRERAAADRAGKDAFQVKHPQAVLPASPAPQR